jgi:hypothetical protein
MNFETILNQVRKGELNILYEKLEIHAKFFDENVNEKKTT